MTAVRNHVICNQRHDMSRYVVIVFGMALLIGSCSFPGAGPSPMPPTLTPQPALSPTPGPAPPASGSALFFDGQDDYVRVEDDPSLDLANSFTIAAWIYLLDYAEWASVVTKGDKPNINNYAFHQSGPNDPIYGTEFGKLRFSGCNTPSAPLPESATTMSLGMWYFVAVTFDGSRITFYLNGTPDGSHAVTGPLCTNDQPLYIGVDFPLTTEYWHGAIDELRIWNVALAESQIRATMIGIQASPDPALVGYWSFDEGSGSTVRDSSGHDNHGVTTGGPLWINLGSPVP